MEQYTGYNQNMQAGMNPNLQPGVNPNMQPGMGPNMQANANADGGMKMEEMYKKLKKDMLINRIISIVTLVFTTAILVVAIFAFVELKGFLTEIEPVVEELSKIDIEALNASLNHFNDIIETFNLDDVMETINSIDFEGINEIMEGLDVEELTETLENINEGAERLDKIGDWFENSPLNIFGLGSN